MKLTYLRLSLVIVFSMLLFSCSQELQETSEFNETTNLLRQAKEWKTTPITQELVENQQNISHYEFEVNALKALVDNSAVNYVWFDLGVNNRNQITFTATGVDTNDNAVAQVASA